ncbi:MAG: Omp85 family outer membrane protein [Longimicrobiales bacterium]
MTRHAKLSALCAAAIIGLAPPSLWAQQAARTGLEFGGVPAINFDSDEGFGYGVITEFYQYGDGSRPPYAWTLQPRVFLTTEGRRDVTVFFDAPDLFGGAWRLTAFGGTEKQIATPYYGLGNDSQYDESLDADDGPNPYFFRYGRTRDGVTAKLQRRLSSAPMRLLFGAGVQQTRILPVPEGEGTTVYAQEVSPDASSTWTNFLQAGLVYDTRDRETGPTRGAWAELLVQRSDDALGADHDFTRITAAGRHYLSLSERLVLAQRIIIQHASSGIPEHELSWVQSSFKDQEGLGGAKSLRGVQRNRYAGRGMALWNAELRWRAARFGLLGRNFTAVLSGFVDQGRVWRDGVELSEIASDLHRGFGGGLRVAMGENFVVAFDAGTSAETTAPIYIGLGYLY